MNDSPPVRHSYADRAAHFRAQAAAARAADRPVIAAQLDTLACRADTAHRVHGDR